MEPLENLTRNQRWLLENGPEDVRNSLRQRFNLDLNVQPTPEEEEEEDVTTVAPTPRREQPQLTRNQQWLLENGPEDVRNSLRQRFGITGDVPPAAETEGEVPRGFTGQFLRGRNYRVVRDYMEANFGMTEENYSREDIVESYINNMRGFSAGNSVRVVSELSKLYQAGDDKTKYEEAYRLWDEASGVFSSESGATTGERIEGVLDYARAAILDPANLLTFGVGKLAGMAGGRVAAEGGRRLAVREVAQQAVRRSVEEAGEEAATRAAGRTALERQAAVLQARQEARQRTVAEIVEASTPEAQMYQRVLRRSRQSEIVGGTAMEMITAGAVDVAYQEAMIEANVQEEFNPLQFAVSTFIPAAVGGVVLARATGSTDVSRIINQNTVQTAIERSHLNRVNAAIVQGEQARKELDVEELGQTLSNRIKEGIEGFRTWQDKVTSGELIVSQADETPISRIGEKQAVDFFYNGSESLGIPGISQALSEVLDMETLYMVRAGSMNFTDAIGNVLEFLPRYRQMEVLDFFNQTVGTVVPSLKMDSISDVVSYLSKESNAWGKAGATLSQANENLFGAGLAAARNLKGNASKQTVAKTVKDEVPSEETVKEVKESLISRGQNYFIRALVTHPGTTMLNLLGWAQMSSINTVSNTLRGTVYGGVGLIEGLVKGDMKASTYAHKAAMEFGSLKRQLSNLVNPYATYDQAMSYLLARPEARKNLFKYIAGGVESGMDEDAILRQAGLEGADPSQANFFEKYMQAMQVLYGVRAVDFMSKTQEFMTNLDRQIRRNYGQSYEEFLQRDDFYELMTSKNSETFKQFATIESVAVEDTLRATFNKSFASDEGLGQVARIIEDIRKIPIIGALAPFGQFFNNTMALTADLSGASIPYHMYLKTSAKRLGKDYVERDRTELMTKMAIGWGLVGWSAMHEYQNLEDGLPWYAERQSDGTVVDRRYDFPWAAFKGYGRMIAHWYRDGSIPADLTKEVFEIVGPGSFSRQLNETYGSVVDGVLEVLSDPESEFGPALWNVLEVSMAQYGSGLTRSLDPLNQVIALTKGEEYEALDRSVGNRNINNAIRYVDQFLTPFMDPERQAPISATTGREPAAQTNRIFGYRELPAPSVIERMFTDIGRPNWKTEIRVPDPMAARVMKEHIFPYLEYEAAQLLESPLWERSNLEQRELAVRRVITGARSSMMESLRRSYDEPDRKAALIFDIFNTGLRARARDRLIESYEVTPETLWTLTEDQLDDLLYVIKREGRVERETSSNIREGDYR